MPNFYLFDIDGTLVDLTDIHARAYLEAYKKVLGFKSKEITRKKIISTFGLIEYRQHKQIFKNHNLQDNGRIEQIIDNYEKSFVKKLNSIEVRFLPGVIEFLNYLENNRDYIGIATANPKKKAELIFKKAGLYKYFSLFAYDKGFTKRADIIKEATNIAKEKNYQFEETIIIGDTISDIQAGKEAGVVTVGVASGTQSREILEKEKPDVILDNLTQYPEILKVVNKKRR